MDKIQERLLYLRGTLTQQEFADKIGIAMNTYRSYEKGSTPPSLDFIRKAIKVLDLSYEWLVLGEAEKEKPDYNLGKRLSIALDYRKISLEEVMGKTAISKKDFDNILNNKLAPSYEFLEKLYNEFALNPAYLMSGNEYEMFEKRNQLERIRFLVDHAQSQKISKQTLERWFGCTKDEAQEFLEENKEQETNISYDWLVHFSNQLIFNHGWITDPKKPMVFFHEAQKQTPYNENNEQDIKTEKSA